MSNNLIHIRSLTGAELDKPVWHALRVAPGKEQAKAKMLRRAGIFALYPFEDRKRFFKGKTRTTRHALVTQIVYAMFRSEPRWHVLRERRIITGVFCNGVRPIEVHPDIIRQVQGLPTRAEKLQEAKQAMERQRYDVHPGDRAKILSGPLEGLAVQVTELRGSEIYWQLTGTTMRGSASHGTIRKDVA